MIVDWAENCAKIFRTGELTMDDAFDRIHRRKQEIRYLAYLLNAQHFTREQIYTAWLNLKYGSAENVLFNDEWLRLTFQDRMNVVATLKDNSYLQRLHPITIYQGEIDFLNRLSVPLWIKQYWCALLVYYKFEIQNTKNRVIKNSRIDAWALRQTEYADPRFGSVCQDRIAAFQQRLKYPAIIENVQQHNHTFVTTYRPCFLCESGNIAISIASISEVQQVIKLCRRYTMRCSMCGAEFEVMPYTQRQVCQQCYPKLRRIKDAARKRKKYAEQKTQQETQNGSAPSAAHGS